jgi:hypothetical protein
MRLLSTLAFLSVSSSLLAQDTLAPASLRYDRPGIIQRIFIGGNYRNTWETPVRVPLFNLKSTNGGYTIRKLGGGQQTKSLQIVTPNDTRMVIRTIDKTVDKAMEAQGIKSNFIKNITQSMISAAHPYGALAVPPIANAVGVVTADPQLYYVPKNGVPEYDTIFADQMVLLEQKQPTFEKTDKTEDTEKLYKDLANGKPLKIDLTMMLQARLIDMLIGDWDRHGGQWQWGYRKGTGKNDSTYVYPIPVDHDQAFFHSNGILVSLVRPFTMKHLVGYKDNMRRIKKLNRKEWDFDKAFIGQLPEAQWESGIRRFQQQVTDDVLHSAVNQMPAEVVAKYGAELFQKLQGRRNTLLRDGMRYHHFLEKRPLAELYKKAENARDEKVPDAGAE